MESFRQFTVVMERQISSFQEREAVLTERVKKYEDCKLSEGEEVAVRVANVALGESDEEFADSEQGEPSNLERPYVHFSEESREIPPPPGLVKYLTQGETKILRPFPTKTQGQNPE
jgi:hypothetical protein